MEQSLPFVPPVTPSYGCQQQNPPLAVVSVGIQELQGVKIIPVPFQSPSFLLFALNGNLGTNIQQAWTSLTGNQRRETVTFSPG